MSRDYFEKTLHIPVMVHEVINLLNIKEGGIYVDATIGAGGHAQKILDRLGNGILIGIDIDPEAIRICSEKFRGDKRVKLFNTNYSNIDEVISEAGVSKVDGILIDAGLSSFALDNPERGFSYQSDGPLDMRMDTASRFTAKDLLFSVDEATLIRILKEYGDVPKPHKVARAILKRRELKRLDRVFDLVEAIREAYSTPHKIPEETRQIFQAIRIAVNNELSNLEKSLKSGFNKLKVEGRFVVITFHSGEDRVVKNFFNAVSRKGRIQAKDGKIIKVIPPFAKQLTPKPLVPSDEEINKNSRAKSAKLRAIEKITDEGFIYSEEGSRE